MRNKERISVMCFRSTGLHCARSRGLLQNKIAKVIHRFSSGLGTLENGSKQENISTSALETTEGGKLFQST